MKPIILTFTGHYIPGYKAGGILHNLINTVDSLCDEFDFWIVTRDRDLGDDVPYTNVRNSMWQPLGNAMVYYVPPHDITMRKLMKLIGDTRHDLLYFTSLFEALTVKVLFCRRLNLIPGEPIIVEPNGEFGWASFRQKYLKKIAFIQAARLLGIYDGVVWRAAGKAEQEDIVKYMKVKQDKVRIAAYMPEKSVDLQSTSAAEEDLSQTPDFLKIIFLSRIAPEKNLDFALKVLRKVKAQVVFDIYGPVENSGYWKKCQNLTSLLPNNIKVNYLGELEHSQVKRIFSLYDMFFFPSAGEAYGMVIAESLAAGTTVLTSDKTAWRDLQSDDLGWDVPLKNDDEFAQIIDYYASISPTERLNRRLSVKNNIAKRLFDPRVRESNLMLFHETLGKEDQFRH